MHGVGRGPEPDARCFYEMQRSKNAKTRTEKDSRVFDGSSRGTDSRVRFPLALPEIACICKLFFDAPGDAVAIRLPYRVRAGCCQPFEALDSFSLRFWHEVRVSRERDGRRGVTEYSYKVPLLLAKAILRSEMRCIEEGGRIGSAFLIPTPTLVKSQSGRS